MSVERFSSPNLQERMCRTWACKVSVLTTILEDVVNCNVYKGQGVLSTELMEECRCHNRFYHLNLFFFYENGSPRRKLILEIKPKSNSFDRRIQILFTLFCTRDLLLGEQQYAKNNHRNSLLLLFVNKRCFLSRLHSMCVSLLFICINLHKIVSSSQE